MSYAILIIIISSFAGYLITHFLDNDLPFSRKNQLSDMKGQTHNPLLLTLLERVAYGVVLGLALFSWLAYLFSLFYGLQYICIIITISLLVIFIVCFLISRWADFSQKTLAGIINLKHTFLLNKFSYSVHIIVFCFFSVIFYRLFNRIIIWHNGDMYVGMTHNYGDLPLHLSYITSFVQGDNIPPQNTIFAGEKLAYPILSDFLSAIFLKLGVGFKEILLIPGFVLTTAFYGILYYFVFRLTKKRVAALVAAFIFFFAGGFGFFHFIHDLSNSSTGIWHFVTHLSSDYTKIPSLKYQWITPLSCLNVPQRALLFGFPITIIIFTLLYRGIESLIYKNIGKNNFDNNKNNEVTAQCDQSNLFIEKIPEIKSWKMFLFAGIVAGLLPLLHTHSFMAMLMVAIPLGLIFWNWRNWFFFFFPAFILSLPQIISLSTNVGSGTFFQFHFGWMAVNDNIVWFWLKNTGIFWIVYIGGLVAIFIFKKREPISLNFQPAYPSTNSRFSLNSYDLKPIYFSLTFLILFFLPNFILFAPGKWDNIKIFIYWFLGSLPIAAIGLSVLYEAKRFKILTRTVFFLIIFVLVFSGGIDIFRYAIAPIYGWEEFTEEEVQLAKRIDAETEPGALFLNAPVHNHVVFLTGRKAIMGYPGHIWSHGYKDYGVRAGDIKDMLNGKPNAIALIEKYKPDYATIGHHERNFGVNKEFFDINYNCILISETYNVYDLRKRRVFGAINDRNHELDSDQKGINTGHGLPVRYYKNVSWKGASVYKDLFLNIDFNWEVESAKPVQSPFSAILEGYIDVPVTGQYGFHLVSDDGSWLYIDNNLLIDNGGAHARKSVSGLLVLEKGKHNILIKYFDAGGGAILKLLWTIPGTTEKVIVPAGNFLYK